MKWTRSNMIVAAGETVTETLCPGGLPCRSVLAVGIAGETGFSVVLSFECSPDEGTTWAKMPFTPLNGNSDVLLAESVTLTTETVRLLAGIDWLPASWPVRIVVENSGVTEPATLDLWLAGC